LRAHLAGAGASFWHDLQAATGVADQQEVLAALWDLVWAGEVTNDTLAPVRSFLHGTRRAGRDRARPGRLKRTGPPAGAGRWSLLAPLLSATRTPTEVAHARAQQVLERYGVVTRESVLGEGLDGGFAAVYPVLKAMEESGQVRRGYFVAGLGAAQFAVHGAVDRLRGTREMRPSEADWQVLAATDPANPYGAALPWPETRSGRPGRTAGAYVVLLGGRLVAHLERGGRTLTTFGDPSEAPHWVPALASLVTSGRRRKLELATIDGDAASGSPVAGPLRDIGFTDGYRGLMLRAT
jgi:ATP-dependent Lhr-like helicase